MANRQLKIWTIACHALILIGAGHGIAPIFIIEIISFPYITKDDFSFSFSGVNDHVAVIGMTIFLGQIVLLFSILTKNENYKNASLLIGLAMLWLSIAYFMYDAAKDSYKHIALITVIPFAVCTILAFAKQPLKKFFHWVIDK